jgi:hypothetical protein
MQHSCPKLSFKNLDFLNQVPAVGVLQRASGNKEPLIWTAFRLSDIILIDIANLLM